mmetsp:Transcript_72218/g.189279  ORF Transcript_72218/g.189279 Transcript_72218/m.189279 type:complete len:246 (-) Transcript_72218:927-1664(-)
MRLARSPHIASHSFWWFSSASQALSSCGGFRMQTVPPKFRSCFFMVSMMTSSFFFLPPPADCHFGFRWTSIWSLKPPQMRARRRHTSSQKIFLYWLFSGYCAFTSSSRLSTLKRMVLIRFWMAVWPVLRGPSSFSILVQRSTASQVSASNFLGMTFQSRAKAPMAFGPRGAPARIHWAKRSRSISGSECRPWSHQSRAAKDLSSFLQYSFWSFSTSRLGVLKGSAAVRPATMAIASHGICSMSPK